MNIFYYGGYFCEESESVLKEFKVKSVCNESKVSYSKEVSLVLRKGKKKWLKRKGVLIKLSGRLKGVDRASVSSWSHYGISPNRLSVNCMLSNGVVKTKWGVWNLKVGVR